MAITDFPGYNILTCTWLPLNNILFQVANSWLCVLYIGDFINFPSPFAYMVFLRIVLAGCAASFTAWAAWVLCSPDTALWNFVFLIYNTIRLVHLLYREYINPTVTKPRFEKLFNTCYKGSGISVDTYNKLIEGGTVVATPKTQSLLLHKTLYTPHKIVQIISGRILIHLINGNKVRLREGDFINHDNWNFNTRCGTNGFVENYSVLTDTLVISWSYPRLTETLRGQERRLFSCLLLSNLNTLLLHLTNILDQADITLHFNNPSNTSNFSNSSETETDEKHDQHRALLLHKTNNSSSDSCGDSGIDNAVISSNESAGLIPRSERGLWSDKNGHTKTCEYVALLEVETGL